MDTMRIMRGEPPRPTGDGFYRGKRWSARIIIDGTRLRERVETLLIKGDSVFLQFTDENSYRIPGGGTERYCSMMEQASRECEEEIRVTPERMEYFGYYIMPSNRMPEFYDGSCCHVFVGQYGRKYHGYVAKDLQEAEMMRYGKFYRISDVASKLKPAHLAAIKEYLG